MDSAVILGFKESDLISFAVAAFVGAMVAVAVCAACFVWLRREQRRLHTKITRALGPGVRGAEEIFLTGRDPSSYGELVAQFKVNHGKQVVSVLEAEGKRFIHVVGDLSPNERTHVVRYLRSEGFMS